MHAKNKVRRYYNLIRKFSNWRQYLLFKIFSRKDSFNFQLRNSFCIDVPKQFLSAFKESFFDEIYSRKLPDTILENKEKEIIVVDIGANVGYFSLFMFSQFPKARIYAFEPMPYNYKLLDQCRKKYHHFRLHTANKAISDTNSTIVLHASKIDGYTTMASIFHRSTNDKIINVEAMTLENVMKKYNLNQIDFLKLDCEGAEYSILYSIPKAVLEKVSVITVETHKGMKADENTFSLKRYLEQNKFKLEYLDEGRTGYIWAWKTICDKGQNDNK